MFIIGFLLRSFEPSRKKQIIIGSSLLLLFAASAVYLSLFFELPIPAVAAAAAALGFVFFRAKIYSQIFKTPLIVHVIALLAGAYVAVRFYTISVCEALQLWTLTLSSGLTAFFVAEILFSLLMSAVFDKPHPENFLKALAALFPLFFTVFVYVPSESYFLNSKDFLFVYFDFAPYIFIKTAAFTFIGAVAACVLRRNAFRIFTGISAGLTLCVYCQYNFMNSDLPSAFGEPMDSEVIKSKIPLNCVIWVLLLLLPTVFAAVSGRIKKISGNKLACNAHLLLNCFIGGVQVLSLAILIFTADCNLFSHERYILNSSEQFVVSSKKNVITFIVDEADRHYFDDVYEQSSERFDFLKDFTYYQNACMMYDSTYLSIPQMLSGSTEPPETNLNAWLVKTWESEPCNSFYSRLHEADYKVNFYGDFAYNFNPFADKIDNCSFEKEENIVVLKSNVLDNINALAAYRYLPLMFKEESISSLERMDQLIGYTNSCIIDNHLYLDSIDLKKSDSDKNYFIVQHILGAHWLSFEPMPDRIYTCLDILKKYIDQLKEMDLYDDAVIIITADHGKHHSPDNMPIWYIKTAGAHNDEMQYSNAPIHHSDYLATCIEALGLKKEGDSELFGRSIFEIPEDEQRERLVFQRYGFEYVGEIDWKKCLDKRHTGGLLGYYFTGDREDLAAREKSGPPDVVKELDGDY